MNQQSRNFMNNAFFMLALVPLHIVSIVFPFQARGAYAMHTLNRN